MSHIVQAKTKIICPDPDTFFHLFHQGGPDAVAYLPFIALLRQAVTVVASIQKGMIEPSYLDFSGNRHPTNTGLALHIPVQAGQPTSQALSRGIGLSLEEPTGVLTFLGDPYGVKTFYETIQGQIIQTYVALAYAAAMRLENYQWVRVRAVQENLVVSGGMYA